jgi:formate/nitrite transporter FocA (FNT family)
MLDRQDAVATNLQFFVKNPLVGDRIAEVLHGTNHNTSSTMLLFAILGIAGGTLNVAAWIALLWKRERNIAGNLILLVILFLSFNTQNLVANVFFWLFPMMALVERGLPLIEKE